MQSTNTMQDGSTILKLEGTVSVADASELHKMMLATAGEDAGLTLDLGEVSDIDTAGLQILFGAIKAIKEGGREVTIAGNGLKEPARRIGLDFSGTLDGWEESGNV